jgi:hypothetical protein
MCNKFDPKVQGKKVEVIAFFESKGFEIVEDEDNANKFKMNTPSGEVVVEFNSQEDDATDDVSGEIDRLAKDEDDDLNPNAVNAKKRRGKVSKKAIDNFEDSTQNIEKNLK